MKPIQNVMGSGDDHPCVGTGAQNVATPGTSLTPSFEIGNTTVAAEFLVIPEPSTAVVGSLGLLAPLRRSG